MNSMISMQWHPMHALHDAHKSLDRIQTFCLQ